MVNKINKIFHTEQLCLKRSSGTPVPHLKLNATYEFTCLTISPFGAYISKRSPRRNVVINMIFVRGLELKYLDYKKGVPKLPQLGPPFN